MEMSKNIFKNILKLLLGSAFALTFSLFFASSASADEYICECILENAGSRCGQEEAAHSICIKKSFIEGVINQPGANFDLKDSRGNDLNTVKVTNNLFEIKDTKKVYFSPDPKAKINNENLDIDITVEGSEYSFVSFRKTNIGGCSNWEEEGGVEFCPLADLEVGAKTLEIKATYGVFAKSRWIGVKEKVDLTTTGGSDKEMIVFEEIYVPEPVAAGDAVNISTAGIIKGGRWDFDGYHISSTGDIFAQPGWHQTGGAGSINLSAKTVQVGTINAMGYPDSGQLKVEAENAYFEDIALHSIKGWFQDGEGSWLFSDDLTEPANQSLTVNGDIKSFRAKQVYLQAADGITDIDITAEDRIYFESIDAYSGCLPETVEEIEDYPGKPKRKICQVGNSGNVNLTVTREMDSEGRGIWIENGIYNDASIKAGEGSYDTVPDGEDLDGGQSFTGKISLMAEDALVYIGDGGSGRGSIHSYGFHQQKDKDGIDIYDIHIKGRFIYLRSSIKADGYGYDDHYSEDLQQVFPEEVDEWPDDFLHSTSGDEEGVAGRNYIGGANIKIEPVSAGGLDEGCEMSQKGGCLLFKDIYNSGKHPFAPNGGRVEIKSGVMGRSAYRVEAYDFSIKTNAVDMSRGWDKDSYEAWYVRDGLRKNPNNDNYVAYNNDDFDDFCDGSNEYIDGADAGINKDGESDRYSRYAEGLDGGNGGDVLVAAQMIQPYRYESSAPLSIDSAGGKGGRGGKGGAGEYCYDFDDPSHVIPQIGYGERGGHGGQGGDITFKAQKILNTDKEEYHCFTSYSIKNNGGTGGPAGDTNMTGLDFAPFRMGTCDLAGWGSLNNTNQIPEIKSVEGPGKGGDAGNITLSPMPTDLNTPVESAQIYSYGGNANNSNVVIYPPYPYYCTGVSFEEENPKAGNGAHAQKYMDVYKNVEMCLEDIERQGRKCSLHCEEKYSMGSADYSTCLGECGEAESKAKSQCRYTSQTLTFKTTFSADDGDFVIKYYKDGTEGDFRCHDWDPENCRPKVPQAVCMVPGADKGGFTSNETLVDPDYKIGAEKVGNGKLLEAAEAKPPGVGDDMIAGRNGKTGGKGGEVEIDTEWGDYGSKRFNVEGGDGSYGIGGQDFYISQPGEGGDGGAGGDAGSVKVEQPEKYVSSRYLSGGKGKYGGVAGTTPGLALPHGNYFCRNSVDSVPFWDWNYVSSSGKACDKDSDCDLDKDCSGGRCVEKFACFTEDQLDSCREREPFGYEYNAPIESLIKIDLAANNGEKGKDGEEGNKKENTVNQASFGVCENEDPIPDPLWVESEKKCCDGIDNDKDGFVDCQDPDCKKECYINPGLLMKGLGTKLTDPDHETWEKICEVVICNDDHDNDEDGPVDIEDKTDCEIKAENTPPKAEDLTVQQTGGCEEKPEVKLSWTFKDDDEGDNQQGYEVEVEDDDGNIKKEGMVDSPFNYVEYSDLEYGDYLWRVRVSDGKDWGPWALKKEFALEKWPWPQFDYRIFQKISGEDWGEPSAWYSCNYNHQTGPCTTIEDVYDLKIGFNNTTQNCPNGCDFLWDFGDGDDSVDRNPPDHVYPANDRYTLNLKAQDKENPARECFQEMDIDLGGEPLEPPKWREITPSYDFNR